MKPEASEFDSTIFGLRVGWAQNSDFDGAGFDLVFLRSPYPAPLHPRAALIDVRLDLIAQQNTTGESAIQRADEDGCAFAVDLAASAFAEHSRYCRDPRLCRGASKIYAQWVCGAHARGELYVAEGLGFLGVRKDGQALRLDIIAVAPIHRGQGVGKRLVREFLSLAGPKERRVKVEAGNVRATNVYLSSGFSVAAAESVQHVYIDTKRGDT